MNRHIFPAAVIGLLFLAPNGTSAQADGPRYTIQIVNGIDGFVPTITGMNDAGQMSGYVTLADGTTRALRYSGGVWSHVPGLDGVSSLAKAINVYGDLVGYESGGAIAFRYSDAVGLTVIPSMPGASSALPAAINADGDVVGSSSFGSETRGWIARHGADAELLPTLGGTFSEACGINDNGQVTGSSTTADNNQHAFRVESDGSIADLGALNGPTGSSAACAIDAEGRVAGASTSASGFHAFLFDAGVLSDLDSFGSFYSAVNATAGGVSVGFYYDAAFQQHAMAHTSADGARDLNNLTTVPAGWILNQAVAVNGKGEIVVAGSLTRDDGSVESGVFKLTPVVTGDVTAPTFDTLSVTPSSVTPPNKAMVPVAFTASATDDRDPNPVCAVTALDAHGAPAGDAAITGPLAGVVRATGGATYSFTVTCHDATGNATSRGLDVVVPPDTTAPSIASVTVSPSSITPPNGRLVSVTVSVTASDNSQEAPVCGVSSLTTTGANANDDSRVTGQFTADVRAVGGRTYALGVECHDAAGNSAVSSVNVVVPPDTTAPSIASVTANPSTVALPNGNMVPVTVSVNASDNSGDAPVCSVTSVTSAGMGPDDVSVTGPLTALVRAVGGRTYTVRVACHDAAGNTSTGSTCVVIARDTTAPSITSLSATPSRIWPPNGKMTAVVVSVTATDDVDAAPRCTLTSIAGGSAGDTAITGALSANVRGNRDAVYTLRVTCSDRAGNQARADVSVVVLKDDGSAAAAAAARKQSDRDGDEPADRNERNEKDARNERARI